ncbi:MAG TPA: hypothetical protein VFO67_20350 [Gemmatimonadales bacterium]|nr:hypothetical protein [Gemmatimonadales bacterium]
MRRVVDTVFTRPEYQWVERRQPLWWLGQLIGRFFDWLSRFNESHPVGSALLTFVAAVLLVLILVHLGYTIWKVVRSPAGGATRAGQSGGPVYDAAQHLALAEELARAGRYAEALGHRFLAVILELDRATALRFHASKTPAEYLSEARLDSSGRQSFALLVGRLYRHLFGALPCAESDYREFGALAQELTRHVAPA